MFSNMKIVFLVLFILMMASCAFAYSGSNEHSKEALMLKGVYENNIKLLSESLKNGGDANFVSDDGKSMLIIAMENKNLEAFSLLIKHGADVNFRASDGDPRKRLVVMELAAVNDDTEYLKLLLDNGGNPNSLDSYASKAVLFEAAKSSQLENVKILVSAGAKLDSLDGNEATALHIAIAVKNFDIAHYLIDKGASLTAQNKWGYSPVDLIEKFGNAGVKKGSEQQGWYEKVLVQIGEANN